MNDENFWKKYAEENESRYNPEFAKYVKDLVISLRCTSVLEIGCGTGIDLRLFPDDFVTNGVDITQYALDIASKKQPSAVFKLGDITQLPFEDNSIDFVFTHGLLNYLDDETVAKGVSEMFRVSSKYIMNCEKFGESEESIDEHHKYRNMKKYWRSYNVMPISDVDMHEDIEPDKPRFTLIRKMPN